MLEVGSPAQTGSPANGAPPHEAYGRSRKPLGPRVLAWVVGLVLVGLLASLATGFIPDRAHPEIVPLTSPVEGFVAPPPNGWGPIGQVIGRYRLRDATLTHDGATTPLPLGKYTGFHLFELEPNKEAYEEEGKEPPKVQTGLMELLVPASLVSSAPTLGSSTATLVLYLSELSSDADAIVAKIRSTSYTGPIIGYFSGARGAAGSFSGTAYLHELGASIHGEFVRYSKSPEAELTESYEG